MTMHVCPHKPWQRACFKLDTSGQLPDFVDLSEQPQLACVAVLHVAAKTVAQALAAHHGVGRRLQDELCEDPDCVITVLAHLIADQCNQLSELIAAYRLAVHRPVPDDKHELPF